MFTVLMGEAPSGAVYCINGWILGIEPKALTSTMYCSTCWAIITFYPMYYSYGFSVHRLWHLPELLIQDIDYV